MLKLATPAVPCRQPLPWKSMILEKHRRIFIKCWCCESEFAWVLNATVEEMLTFSEKMSASGSISFYGNH